MKTQINPRESVTFTYQSIRALNFSDIFKNKRIEFYVSIVDNYENNDVCDTINQIKTNTYLRVCNFTTKTYDKSSVSTEHLRSTRKPIPHIHIYIMYYFMSDT